MTTSRRRGTALAAALTLVSASAGVIAAAGPAAAHTELVSSTPSNGRLLKKPPQQAKLTFSDQVTPRAKAIALRTSTGKKIATGTAYSSGRSVIVPIKKSLPDGTYVLSYSVISADQHTVKGTIAFRVKRVVAVTTSADTHAQSPHKTGAGGHS